MCAFQMLSVNQIDVIVKMPLARKPWLWLPPAGASPC
jgi:hypothetical protein